MTPDPEKVRIWEARAPAYDGLCRRWQIFSQLSNRLIDLLPADLEGPVLDIGAGTGLTSEILLRRRPRCEAILIEPSEAMVELARERLAGRAARFFAMGLGGAPVSELRVVAALASASMQFVDLEPGFRTLAHVVEPGGCLAFNLWYHHWEDTAALKCMAGWEAIAQAACEDARLPTPAQVTSAPPVARTRMELTHASRTHGFQPISEHRDEYPTPVGFGIDFMAMDPSWPVKGIAPEARQAVLAKMHELAEGKLETLVSTRFLFQRDCAPPPAARN